MGLFRQVCPIATCIEKRILKLLKNIGFYCMFAFAKTRDEVYKKKIFRIVKKPLVFIFFFDGHQLRDSKANHTPLAPQQALKKNVKNHCFLFFFAYVDF